MIESKLLICLIGLLLLAVTFLLVILRRSARLVLALTPTFIICALAGYWYWGNSSELLEYQQQLNKQQQVNAVLQTIKSPEELIQKLKQKLDNNPDSARGWYLLGRLYASQNQWENAKQAYYKAMSLNPADVVAAINFVQSSWQLNNRKFNEETRVILDNILKQDAKQPDALAMIAMDAYINGNYQKAIDNWQVLLDMSPEQSPEARSLRRAIAKAQQQL